MYQVWVVYALEGPRIQYYVVKAGKVQSAWANKQDADQVCNDLNRKVG